MSVMICIEASHTRGMGHLYRSLVLADYLRKKNITVRYAVNAHEHATHLLQGQGFEFITVNLQDSHSNWETSVLEKFAPTLWINDRLETTALHASRIRPKVRGLVTFDDRGPGAQEVDLHFAAMIFQEQEKASLRGRKILTGPQYLLLPEEVEHHKKQRTSLKNILVSLGGSDTHGTTVTVVRLMQKIGLFPTVHTGPSFKHHTELSQVLAPTQKHVGTVSSLIELFSEFDLLVCGGGVTPFEANATGLPCIIVANEHFEEQVGKYLDHLGSSVYLCHHSLLDDIPLKNGLSSFHEPSRLQEASRIGMNAPFGHKGVQFIFNELEKYLGQR